MIEPGRLVIPFMYEALARGFRARLSDADQEAIRELAPWACRSLQAVLQDVASRCATNWQSIVLPSVARRAKEVIEMQEQIGQDILDSLEMNFRLGE